MYQRYRNKPSLNDFLAIGVFVLIAVYVLARFIHEHRDGILMIVAVALTSAGVWLSYYLRQREPVDFARPQAVPPQANRRRVATSPRP